MSDIHLEFGPFDRKMPTGDVLILAGDITLAGVLDPADDLHHRGADLYMRTVAFFTRARENFSRVFYLIGNHEAYSYNISKTPQVIRSAFPFVTLLNDTVVSLNDDTLLVGGTLWTDMNKGKAHDYIGGAIGHARMNDFNLIWMRSKRDVVRFSTYDAASRFSRTKRLIAKTAKLNPEKKIVVATHHAPSYRGVNPEHGGGTLDAGYASDLEDFIKVHRNITHWIHGHTHIQAEYKVGTCTVHSNARGYVNRESSATAFDPDRWFEVGGALALEAA